MNHGDLKSNDPMQLKQAIIYLRAELNKYQTKDSKTASDLIHTLQAENNDLKEVQLNLLYANKKNEKRLRIYGKRIALLQKQKDELILLNKRLQNSEQDLQSAIQDLREIAGLLDKRSSMENAWMQELDKLSEKVETYKAETKQYENLIQLLADKKIEINELSTELDRQKAISQTQHELIEVLESYVERLVKEPDELQTETILQQIIALTEAYANKEG